MKFFFSETDTSIMDANDTFIDPETGKSYEYCVDFGHNAGGTEEVVIRDAVGRYIPVDLGSLPDLIELLAVILGTKATLENADALKTRLATDDIVVP